MSEKEQRRARAEAKAVRLKEKREQHIRHTAVKMQIEQSKNTEIWQSFIESYSAELKGDSGSGDRREKREGEEHTDEVQKLCARGIPPNMRGAVWPLLIGNKIQISDKEFSELRVKADELRTAAGLGSFTPSPTGLFKKQESLVHTQSDSKDGKEGANTAGEKVEAIYLDSSFLSDSSYAETDTLNDSILSDADTDTNGDTNRNEKAMSGNNNDNNDNNDNESGGGNGNQIQGVNQGVPITSIPISNNGSPAPSNPSDNDANRTPERPGPYIGTNMTNISHMSPVPTSSISSIAFAGKGSPDTRSSSMGIDLSQVSESKQTNFFLRFFLSSSAHLDISTS